MAETYRISPSAGLWLAAMGSFYTKGRSPRFLGTPASGLFLGWVATLQAPLPVSFLGPPLYGPLGHGEYGVHELVL